MLVPVQTELEALGKCARELDQFVIQKRDAALDAVGHLGAIAQVRQQVAGKLRSKEQVLRRADGIQPIEGAGAERRIQRSQRIEARGRLPELGGQEPPDGALVGEHSRQGVRIGAES